MLVCRRYSGLTRGVGAKVRVLLHKHCTGSTAQRVRSCSACTTMSEKVEEADASFDAALAPVQFSLRSTNPEVVKAWSAVFHHPGSPALKGLTRGQRAQLQRAFVVEPPGDIFAGQTPHEAEAEVARTAATTNGVGSGGAGGGTKPGAGVAGHASGLVGDAIVSPANSFGDMGGGIDLVYRRRFGRGVEAALMQTIVDPPYYGELVVGQALLVPLPQDTTRDSLRYLIAAPTMRVPRTIKGTANAYLAFRAVLLAVRQHNQTAQRLALAATDEPSEAEAAPRSAGRSASTAGAGAGAGTGADAGAGGATATPADGTQAAKCDGGAEGAGSAGLAAGGAGAIRVVLCPGLGTGVGLMPAATCAYQMAMAYRQQVLGMKAHFHEDLDLRRSRTAEEVLALEPDDG